MRMMVMSEQTGLVNRYCLSGHVSREYDGDVGANGAGQPVPNGGLLHGHGPVLPTETHRRSFR